MTENHLPPDVVKGIFHGDEQTYVFLFREYYYSLCAYARRYVGRTDIAEEIVSDTFFRMWENRATLTINTSVKAYLFQAVCNNSLNFLRKLKNENKLEGYFQETTSGHLSFSDSFEDLEPNSMIMEDFHPVIEEAVGQLPEQQQKAFRLKRFEGRKTKEVAEMMGLSVKTVEMHLAKATLNLRNKLKNFLPAFLIFMLLK